MIDTEEREELLEIKNLNIHYRRRGFRKPPFHALKDVSLSVRKGETVGLVGESGSGKTTLGRAVLGLIPVSSGCINFQGTDISKLGSRQRRLLSRDLQVVFQDPYSSLNPAMTIEAILAEPLKSSGFTSKDARSRVSNLLEQVQLPSSANQRLPREFSGGQRQRIAIARALALKPKLIVCDEPVSALDLSTQSHILDLLIEIQEQTDVAHLFISHDISVVRYISHRVSVMLGGQIIESGEGEAVTTEPTHPYTRRLLLASPVPDPLRQAQRREHYTNLTRQQRGGGEVAK